MIVRLATIALAIMLLTIAPAASQENMTEAFDRGDLAEVIELWQEAGNSSAAELGFVLFANYYLPVRDVQSAQLDAFRAARDGADSDDLGVGLGELVLIAADMQAFPYLETVEQEALWNQIAARLDALAQHP